MTFPTVWAQEKAVLQGYVENSESESVSGVLIIIKNDSLAQEFYTDTVGYFSIEIIPGIYDLEFFKKNYSPHYIDNYRILSGIKSLAVTIEETQYITDVITVEDFKRQSQSDLRTSLFNVNPFSIKTLPGGIEDVLRSLKSLPGVTSPNDFTSQLVIRGSGPDQNLIIMDDVEIFNPYRLYGLVSMFNPETLSDISLITGGFPAKYGDRLSAVLDVTNREGTRDRNFSLMTNINIANANLILQGKNPFSVPGSWIVSSRRTYYDLVIGPFAKKVGLITDDSALPSFEDVQFKLALGPFRKNKFILNGIFSRDGVDIISGSDREQADSVNVNDVTYNNVLSLSWHYIPNPGFISKTTLSLYNNKGDNDFEGDILDPLLDNELFTPEQRDSLKAIGALLGFNFDSRYNFLKYSIGNRSTYIRGKNTYEFGGGLDLIKNDINYTLVLDEQFKAYIQQFPNMSALLKDFNIEGKYNYRGNAYISYQSLIKDNFYYQPSVRVDYYSYLNKFYVSPRINFGYAIDKLTTIRLALGVYYQSPGYEKLVDGNTFYDLTDNYNESLKAERAYHFIAGIDRWLTAQWHLKIEGYYKILNNLITQQRETAYRYEYYLYDPNNSNPVYVKNPLNWYRSAEKLPYDSVTSIPVNKASGDSHGFEIMLEKRYTDRSTKLYGWINYSYSKSTRESYGVTKPFRFDQTHTVNVVLNYRLLSWFEIGARWSYATNFPYTPPVGIYPRVVNDTIVVNPFTNQVIFNFDYGEEENRLSERKPEYHRLDLRFTAITKFWGADWSFYLDVINVYNRKNVLAYDYYLNNDLSIKRKTTGMIPILPTIGVTARF